MYTGSLIASLQSTVDYHRQIGEQFSAFAQFDLFLPCWHPHKGSVEDEIKTWERFNDEIR